MRWTIILSLVALNIVLGFVMMFGLIGNVSWWYSIVTAIIFALILCWFVTEKLFMHGFWTGFISGMMNAILMWIFYDTYVANNPQIAEAMAKMPPGSSMRTITLVTSPIGAAVSGAIMGVFAIIFGKLLGHDKEVKKPVESVAESTDSSDTTPQG